MHVAAAVALTAPSWALCNMMRLLGKMTLCMDHAYLSSLDKRGSFEDRSTSGCIRLW